MNSKKRNWTIRSYREGDEFEINALFNKVFESNRSIEEWNWKFKGSFLDMTGWISLLIDENEKIRGHYASYARIFSYLGFGTLVGHPGDTFMDPDFKKGIRPLKELFQTQVRYAADIYVNLGYGFPNKAAYKVGKRILGYRDIGEVPVVSVPVSFGARLESKGKVGELGARLIKRLPIGNATLHHAQKPFFQDKKTGITHKLVNKLEPDFNRFWENVKNIFPICEIRTAQLLNWRYFERPGNLYKMILSETDDTIVGYAVVRIKTPEPGTAYLMDFFSLHDKTIETSILHAAMDVARNNHADELRAWLHPSWPYYESFRTVGFRNLGWSVRAVNIEFPHSPLDPRDFLDITNWYFPMGATDDL